jgi:hypothetical protein
MKDPKGKTSEELDRGPGGRMKYDAPALIWEESLDEPTLAAACGKADPGQGASCSAAPSS